MKRPNMKQLAARIAADNERLGWTIDVQDRKDLGLKVALIASELMEVCDEYYFENDGVNTSFPKTIKELADTTIRTLHLVHVLGLTINQDAMEEDGREDLKGTGPIPTDDVVTTTHDALGIVFTLFEKLRDPKILFNEAWAYLYRTIDYCEEMQHRIDPTLPLWRVVEEKLAFNQTRGFRHGGKAY